MNARFLAFAVAICSAGCGAGLGSDPSAVRAAPAPPEVGYFPLEPGTEWTYAGEEDGLPLLEEIRILDEPRVVLGQACAQRHQTVWVAHELRELTTEYFARDAAGNVWKFGEEGFEVVEGELQRSESSWLAGEDGAEPWIAFPARPYVGMTFFGHSPGGVEAFEVRSVTATVVLPDGSYESCIEIAENPQDPDDVDIILYAPKIGAVLQKSNQSHSVLVSGPR